MVGILETQSITAAQSHLPVRLAERNCAFNIAGRIQNTKLA
jgi:hypothetical protein